MPTWVSLYRDYAKSYAKKHRQGILSNPIMGLDFVPSDSVLLVTFLYLMEARLLSGQQLAKNLPTTESE